jgi:uncharacterized surface anchored protein
VRIGESPTGATVSGLVFVDSNGDSSDDPGDPGLAGVTVTLLNQYGDPVTNLAGSTVSSTITTSDGSFSFGNLPDGTFTAVFSNPPTGYSLESTTETITVPGSGSTVSVGANQPNTISGTVFVDTNQDGVQDNGESGLAGVNVTILDQKGNTVGTATSNSNGSYSVVGLAPGTYSAQFAAPSGYLLNGSSNETTLSVTVTSGDSVRQ